jgi:glycosyltransferase involved in cell wall biosynthesis
MAMARLAGLRPGTRLLYDVRGFFSDERVQAGSWRAGGFVDRFVRLTEAQNLRRADGAVALTRLAALELLRRRPSLPVHRVIPTCADTSVFTPRASRQEPRYGLVFSGSLGTWYLAKEMVAFARSVAEFVPGRTLFLTPQAEHGRRLGVTADWAEIRSVDPGAVASWLRRARALFFLGPPAPSRFPTKFAEGLAAGLPVVCNRGIGDLDDVVEKERVGILVGSLSPEGYREAGRRLRALLEDPELPDRCRRLAESRYSLGMGVASYYHLYRDMISGAPEPCTAGDRD